MRLIDAERLKADVFKASMDEHFMPVKLLDCDTVTEMIDTAPTIEERKTGKWVLHQCQFDGGWDINCSVCGEGDNGFFARSREDAEYKLKHHYLMDKKRRKGMRYCNYCGAKMEAAE